MRDAYLVQLGVTPYREAWDLQRALAARVAAGDLPDTVVLLEHPPTVTLGRRAEEGELHLPADAEVDLVETDRGGKSTYHAPGQLVCYPILDLTRHGQDVRRYCRDLERALVGTLDAFGLRGQTIEGLTGLWLTPPPRKIASIGIHVHKWVTTHGYALNVDLDPAPFTEWITACGLEGAAFTTMARELGRPLTVDHVRSAAAAALERTFGLRLQPAPAADLVDDLVLRRPVEAAVRQGVELRVRQRPRALSFIGAVGSGDGPHDTAARAEEIIEQMARDGRL